MLKSIADLLMKWHATSSLPGIVSCKDDFITFTYDKVLEAQSHVKCLNSMKLKIEPLATTYFISKPFDFIIKYVGPFLIRRHES